MPGQSKKARTVPFNAADLANMARANRYIARVIEDATLRDNVRTAFEHSRSAYGRLSNGKAPAKVLLHDRKLQRDLRNVAEAVRDATIALTSEPKRKRRRPFRKLFIVALAFGLALAGSEKLRTKVLDTLFGAEEEFEYTPPPPPSEGASPPTTPVSAA